MSGDAAAAEARIIGGLAREAAGLGVEIVDAAGHSAVVSTRVEQQARSFRDLAATAGEMNDCNRRIATAAGPHSEKHLENAKRVPHSTVPHRNAVTNITDWVEARYIL